jgi:hypothetical protein
MDFVTFFELVVAQKVSSKRKFVPVHVRKAYTGSRGIAPLILCLGPFITGKEHRYLYWEAGWALQQFRSF